MKRRDFISTAAGSSLILGGASLLSGCSTDEKNEKFRLKTNEELQLPRNKEIECYDFILSDLDEAIRLMPETSMAAGRANKRTAYGLKARVALQRMYVYRFLYA